MKHNENHSDVNYEKILFKITFKLLFYKYFDSFDFCHILFFYVVIFIFC